jgi:hypothetical protein
MTLIERFLVEPARTPNDGAEILRSWTNRWGVGHNYFSKSSKSGASPKTYQSDAAGVEVAAGGGTTSLGLLIIGGVLYRGNIGQSIVVKGHAAPARRGRQHEGS